MQFTAFSIREKAFVHIGAATCDLLGMSGRRTKFFQMHDDKFHLIAIKE